jgi:hypothetical protein
LGILYVYMHKGGVYRALHGIQILCRIMVFADVVRVKVEDTFKGLA